MNNLYCLITGREARSVKLKLFLRLFFFFILATVKVFVGMDWALIVAAVVIVADLDSIEETLRKKFGGKC